jgi:hypothetical protein
MRRGNTENKMEFIMDLIAPPIPSGKRPEVEKMLAELLRIGQTEDFLSERPGGSYNRDCRHIRTCQIGARLHEIGGINLMGYVHRQVKRKLGKTLGEHLEAAWDRVGDWRY